jgi:NAD-dependent dihydropyrimidine dehydrogenase PreA subunit
VNTLRYDDSRCTGCGLCLTVCPHGVFAGDGATVRLARAEACMECGACQRNCPAGAIEVESGVGCATALFYAALTGREACCGPRDAACCPGDGDAERPAADDACCAADSATQGQIADEACCSPDDASKEDE